MNISNKFEKKLTNMKFQRIIKILKNLKNATGKQVFSFLFIAFLFLDAA